MQKHISGLVIGASLTIAAASCSNEVKTPGYIVQVSMGEWDRQFYPTEEIIARIDEVNNIIPLEKVLVGWVSDPEPYRQIGEYLHGKGIQMLLYLPVFAETEGAFENTPAADIWGEVPSKYIIPGGGAFKFNCPTLQSNIDNLINFYEEHLADVDFDGVFLDRIRTQSFVCGVNGVLNCGCDNCAALYKAEGVDLADVRKAYEEKGDKFFSVTSYEPKSGFTFEDATAEAFFKAKGRIVSGAVAKVCDYFHSKGMIVGLDLFAPILAQFVGQDYRILAEHCDFIKPMLYRKTWAPAGIGFDYNLLRQSAPGAEGYPELTLDADFLRGQLSAMEDLPCRKYPGIEIIYDEKIAPTTPEYIIESLNTVLEFGYEGAVVSWNIMQVPNDHIRCLNEVGKAANTEAGDFLQLARDRYSVRSFSSTPVDQVLVDKILLAAQLAPTAVNAQPQKIYVVRSEEMMAVMNEQTPCIYGAPHCFVVCYDSDAACKRRGGGDWGEVDATIAITHMMLEAADLGLGTCLVGMYDPEELSKALSLPANIVPVLIMPFGYAGEDCVPSPKHSDRRPLEETVEYI